MHPKALLMTAAIYTLGIGCIALGLARAVQLIAEIHIAERLATLLCQP